MEYSHPPPSGASTGPSAPRLLDEVRGRMRRLGLAIRTEKTYVDWIRRFIVANGKRHPRDMGAPEVGIDRIRVIGLHHRHSSRSSR